MVRVGQWMRNKETGEAVQVKSTGYFVKYDNAEVEGEVRSDKLEEQFKQLARKPADAEPAFAR